MNPKSPINEVIIANSLLAIFERLDGLEKAANILASQYIATTQVPKVATSPSADFRTAPRLDDGVLRERLANLTLKRHAVLTATLGGQSYQEIAKSMNCDVTTVKLHLKAALSRLGVRNRAELLTAHSDLLEGFPEAEYQLKFSISKRWWLEVNTPLLNVLRAVKPSNNQHIKSTEA